MVSKEVAQMSIPTMFDSFKNLENYIPCNRPFPPFPKPIVNETTSLSALWPLVNAKDEIIGAEWNYGCAFDLPFEVKGNIVSDDGDLLDLEEFFTDKELTVDILDHFYQDFMSFQVKCVPIAQTWSLILLLEFDREVSEQIPRGTYHIRLRVGDDVIYSPLDSVLVCK